MLVPLYGFLRGDTLGILVLADSEDTLAKVADTLVRAAAVRVAPVLGQRVWRDGYPLDPELTVARAGFAALDRIDVAPEAP
jgi:Toluene-4-monooxygenase system protein B (TmoB)